MFVHILSTIDVNCVLSVICVYLCLVWSLKCVFGVKSVFMWIWCMWSVTQVSVFLWHDWEKRVSNFERHHNVLVRDIIFMDLDLQMSLDLLDVKRSTFFLGYIVCGWYYECFWITNVVFKCSICHDDDSWGRTYTSLNSVIPKILDRIYSRVS